MGSFFIYISVPKSGTRKERRENHKKQNTISRGAGADTGFCFFVQKGERWFLKIKYVKEVSMYDEKEK